jgi:hypothetical protein
MSHVSSTQTYLRLEERLRQERETFEQRKGQEREWFLLRLRMGYIAVVMLPGVALACGYILFNHVSFTSPVITAAGAALFTDVLGLLVAVWKVVLNPGSVARLEPLIPDTFPTLEVTTMFPDAQGTVACQKNLG